MKKPTTAHAAQTASQGRNIAGLEIVKVVREFVPITEGGDRTFGQIIDAQLEEAAMNHIEVQQITFSIEREEWFQFADAVNHSAMPRSWEA